MKCFGKKNVIQTTTAYLENKHQPRGHAFPKVVLGPKHKRKWVPKHPNRRNPPRADSPPERRVPYHRLRDQRQLPDHSANLRRRRLPSQRTKVSSGNQSSGSLSCLSAPSPGEVARPSNKTHTHTHTTRADASYKNSNPGRCHRPRSHDESGVLAAAQADGRRDAEPDVVQLVHCVHGTAARAGLFSVETELPADNA